MGISGRERKRRKGYTRNLAHQLAAFASGYQIGFDVDLMPRRGDGLLRDLNLPIAWVKKAHIQVRWRWLGEDYGIISTCSVETADSAANVTLENVQSPLPSPLRTEPYDPPFLAPA